MTTLALPSYAQLSEADEAALTELFRRGTPPNTLRAWERDLAYIAAWKMAAFGQPLAWPEDETVALRFILDHAQDLSERPGPAQDVALELIAIGLRVADDQLPQRQQEGLETIVGLIAVAMITYMIVWMRRATASCKRLSGQMAVMKSKA